MNHEDNGKPMSAEDFIKHMIAMNRSVISDRYDEIEECREIIREYQNDLKELKKTRKST